MIINKRDQHLQERDAEIDRSVGSEMRALRLMRGITQQKLAEMLGTTFQQIHKYEKGINGLRAARLFHTARVFGIDVGSLFAGCWDPAARTDPMKRNWDALEGDLLKCFRKLPDDASRHALLAFAQHISERTNG